ncbi:hypothetical protein BD779DRAFT_889185 [Infundibulicybe gibba]|nr:hypothetical protein BD779DRAFT_889185 [Infundibulicybe gibba]
MDTELSQRPHTVYRQYKPGTHSALPIPPEYICYDATPHITRTNLYSVMMSIGTATELGPQCFWLDLVYYIEFHTIALGRKQQEVMEPRGEIKRTGCGAENTASAGRNLSREDVIKMMTEAISIVHATSYKLRQTEIGTVLMKM